MKYQHMKLFFGIFIAIISIATVFSQAYDEDYCNVFLYPHELEREDILQDGPSGSFLKITGKTALIWVDLEPWMRFTHATCYILISEEGIRIEKGKWWPELNGKKILIDEINRYTVLTPYSLSSGSNSTDFMNIHIYPHELTLGDKLVDGPSGNRINVYPNSLLIWVNLMPHAHFVHPTAYLLISKHGTRVVKGEWWPVLNGKQICYGEQNLTSVISPFKVFRLLL